MREAVDIGSEPRGVDRCRMGERSERGLPTDETVSSKRRQLTDRDAVARHDEALSGIKGSHHLAALVAQLPLRDLARHACTVARVRQGWGTLSKLQSQPSGAEHAAPRVRAHPPSASSIRSSWLFFAARSERAGAPS